MVNKKSAFLPIDGDLSEFVIFAFPITKLVLEVDINALLNLRQG